MVVVGLWGGSWLAPYRNSQARESDSPRCAEAVRLDVIGHLVTGSLVSRRQRPARAQATRSITFAASAVQPV